MKAIRMTISPFKTKSHCLIVPPTSTGSLGDEALLSGLTGRLRELGITSITSLSIYTKNDQWIDQSKEIDDEIILPYFINDLTYSHKIRLLAKAINTDYCFVVGADVMDGAYLEKHSLNRVFIAHLLADFGIPTTICGFSFRENAPASIADALSGTPDNLKVMMRDPVSLQRIRNQGVFKAELAADLAFLLRADGSELTNNICAWSNKQRSLGKPVIGININHLTFPQKPYSASSAVQTFVNLSAYIAKELDAAILFIPHDSRTDHSDWILCNQAMDDLKTLNDRVEAYCLPECASAHEVKGITKDIDFVISGRMHLIIASLSQGTPACGIEYQGKMLGLFELFGSPELRVTSNDYYENPEAHYRVITDFIKNRAIYRSRIKEHLPAVLALSAKNFSAITTDKIHS